MGTKLAPTEVYSLLSKLCVDLGFCLPPDEIARFQDTPPESVDEFTDAVFVAEGLDPVDSDTTLRRQVRDRVAAAFDQHRALN
jgi:hypothetical protein